MNANGLIIPNPPTPYVKKKQPNARFWMKDNWRDYQKDCDSRNRDYGKLDFITDEHGEVVSKSRIAAMSSKARELFTTLRRHNRNPVTWRGRGAEEAEYFSNCMRTLFPEFRLCENDWHCETKARVINNRKRLKEKIATENSDFQAIVKNNPFRRKQFQ
jgi:hypothetical protein